MSARTVYLHIGQPKSGTKTIQRALTQDAAELRRRGLTVWDILENHSVPLDAMLAVLTDGKPRHQSRWAAGEQWQQVRQSLQAALADAPADFLITGEHLYNAGVARLAQLRQVIEASVPTVEFRVVCLLRRPERVLHSYVQQQVKGGLTYATALEQVSILRYEQRLGPVIDVFGPEALSVRLMPEVGDGGPADLLTVFAEAIDRPGFRWQPVEIRNESMSQFATDLAEALNRRRPEGESYPGVNRSTVLQVQRTFRGPPFRLPKADVVDALERCAPSLQWLYDNVGVDFRSAQARGEEPAASPVDLVEGFADVLRTLIEGQGSPGPRSGQGAKAAAPPVSGT